MLFTYLLDEINNSSSANILTKLIFEFSIPESTLEEEAGIMIIDEPYKGQIY